MEATAEDGSKIIRVCYICEGSGKALYLTGEHLCQICMGSGIAPAGGTPEYFIG